MANIKRIALLTSGGDAPGMNACIRAVVRSAVYEGLEVFGVSNGYNGLIENDMYPLGKRQVSDIIQRGGTMLFTARCKKFIQPEGRAIAAKNLKARGIEGLIVIGGDGTMMGARLLSIEHNIPTICIPGTIDNDLNYTDYTLGFDTAVNTVIDAINKLRDTMTSHGRVSLIEVMGRHCGDIALYAGISGGAEIILVPEVEISHEDICKRLNQSVASGKKSSIIILAEGCGSAADYVEMINEHMGIDIRATVLGHIQRGGSPSIADRVLASRFALKAVQLIKSGAKNRAVGISANKIMDMDITDALNAPKKFDYELYEVAKILGS